MQTEEQIRSQKRAYNKRREEAMKAMKKCVRCGKQDERTLSGAYQCNACLTAYKLKYGDKRKTTAVKKGKFTPDGRKFGILTSTKLEYKENVK